MVVRTILALVAGLWLVSCGGGGSSACKPIGACGGDDGGRGGSAGNDGGGGDLVCKQIGTTLCQKACACQEGPGCAMSQGGLTLSFDSESDCLGFFVTLACTMGDVAAYNDSAACLPLAEAATCTGTGEEGAVSLPDDAACQAPE